MQQKSFLADENTVKVLEEIRKRNKESISAVIRKLITLYGKEVLKMEGLN